MQPEQESSDNGDQQVMVVGPDGRPVTAFYPLSQLPDGSWLIDGCYLLAPEEHLA